VLSQLRSSHKKRFAFLHTVIRALLGFAALAPIVSTAEAADAAGTQQNVFAAALVEGRGVAPVPTGSPATARVLNALQAQSGSDEPISIVAQRILRFTQQARCGRISFALAQLNANRVWPAIGGHMNVCEDGQPPLRTCPEHPGVLVPVTSVCADGKPPVDTAEVAAAIRSDVDAGGVTHEQMLHDWFKNINTHAHPSLTAPASSAAARANSEAPK
jgi:hypothetical protein